MLGGRDHSRETAVVLEWFGPYEDSFELKEAAIRLQINHVWIIGVDAKNRCVEFGYSKRPEFRRALTREDDEKSQKQFWLGITARGSIRSCQKSDRSNVISDICKALAGWLNPNLNVSFQYPNRTITILSEFKSPEIGSKEITGPNSIPILLRYRSDQRRYSAIHL